MEKKLLNILFVVAWIYSVFVQQTFYTVTTVNSKQHLIRKLYQPFLSDLIDKLKLAVNKTHRNLPNTYGNNLIIKVL